MNGETTKIAARMESVLTSCVNAKGSDRQHEYEKLLCEDVSLSNFCDYFDKAVEHGLEQLMVRCFKEYLAQYDCYSYHQKLLNLPLNTVMLIDANLEGGSDKYLRFVLDWIKHDPVGRAEAKPKLLKQFYHRWGKVVLDYYAENDAKFLQEYDSDDEDANEKAIFDAAKTLLNLIKQQPEKVKVEPYEVFDDDSLPITNQKLVCLGGNSGKRTLSTTISVYDPATEKWLSFMGNWSPLRCISGAVIGELIYVCGKENKKSKNLSMKVLNTSNSTNNWTWTPVPAPPCTARTGFAMASLLGKVYLAGGGELGAPLADCYCYSPAARTWSKVAAMPTGRTNFELVELGGYLYAVGGTRVVERYNPALDRWDTVAWMNSEMTFPGVVSHRGSIYAGSSAKKFEAFCPESNHWQPLEMFKGAHGLKLASVNNRLLAIRGVNSTEWTHRVWEYRLIKGMQNVGIWKQLPGMDVCRKGFRTFVVGN